MAELRSCAVEGELSSSNRDHMAMKPELFSIWPFIKMFADSCYRSLPLSFEIIHFSKVLPSHFYNDTGNYKVLLIKCSQTHI